MERQIERPQLANLQQEGVFRSSTGRRVPSEKIRTMCNDCQLVDSGDRCQIISTVAQADNTRLPKCEWRRP